MMSTVTVHRIWSDIDQDNYT